MLDQICYNVFGQTNLVEQVLINNPHLAEYGALLPAGINIDLSNIKLDIQDKKISLWD